MFADEEWQSLIIVFRPAGALFFAAAIALIIGLGS